MLKLPLYAALTFGAFWLYGIMLSAWTSVAAPVLPRLALAAWLTVAGHRLWSETGAANA